MTPSVGDLGSLALRPRWIGLPLLQRLTICGLLAGFLSACTPPQSTPTPTQTPVERTPTASLAFPTLPPTPTETLPTQPAPTDPFADRGSVQFAAEFDPAEGWDLGGDSIGATSLIDNSLSVVVSRPNQSRLVASPAPASRDFILVVSFRSAVCQGEDEYGLALQLSPEGDHIRFTITCTGGARLRRVVNGQSRALVPFIEEVPAVTAGAPARNQLIARRQAETLQLYVNNTPVFQTHVPPVPDGGAGLFVRTDGQGNQATIIVEEFILYDLKVDATMESTGSESPDG